MSDVERARRVESARVDDRACRNAGYEWPSPAYTDCRRFRFDARQREQWQELQMLNRQQHSEPGIPSLSPDEPYRPVRKENFRCIDAKVDGEPFIDCRETN